MTVARYGRLVTWGGWEGSDFVSTLGEESRRRLFAAGRRYSHPAGRVVWHEGQVGHSVLVVLTGRLKVCISTAGGDEYLVALLSPGALIGELAVITDSDRTAKITAIDEVVVLKLDRGDFETLVEERADVMQALLTTLAERVVDANERLEALHDEVERRLATQLAQLADRFGRSNGDGQVSIDVPLTQDELASLVWSSRGSVARALRTWREEGIISTGRRQIVVLDPTRLRALAG